jgi:hypothetical protein
LLTVNDEQMQVFARREMERFEERVIAHLREHFPDRMAGVSPQNARELVRHCVERARRHGIESERDIVLFANVVVALGPRFEQERRYKWAAEALTDEFIVTPAARVEELHRRAVELLNAPQRGHEPSL